MIWEIDGVLHPATAAVTTDVERVAHQLALAELVQTTDLPEPEIAAWRTAFPKITRRVGVRSDEASAKDPIEDPNTTSDPGAPSAPATAVEHRVPADQIVDAPTGQPPPA